MNFQSFLLGFACGGMAVAVALWGDLRLVEIKMRRLNIRLGRLNAVKPEVETLYYRLMASTVTKARYC